MMNPPPPAPHSQPNLQDDSVRFQVELEFVQCLANPNYLNFLAQRDYFKHDEFVNYLKYLLYWKEPEYVHYLRYPQCLHILELLQKKKFRDELVNTPCAKFIEDQMILHWQYYSRKRFRIQQSSMDNVRQRQLEQGKTAAAATSAAPGVATPALPAIPAVPKS